MGRDFVPPDAISDIESATDAEDIEFDFWEAEEVMPIAENGTFSWEPPENNRFVLFAVDLSRDVDPVRGLIGVGARGDEDLVWQALNEELLNGEVGLGEIQPEDGSLVWLGEANTESLVESGNLAEADRDQRIFFVLDAAAGAAKEDAAEDDFGNDDWLYLGDYLPEEYEGYAIQCVAMGLEDVARMSFSPPEAVDYDDHHGTTRTLGGDEWVDSALYTFESNNGTIDGLYDGVVKVDDEESMSAVSHQHLSGSWTVEIGGKEFGINLDSRFDEIGAYGDSFPSRFLR